MAWPVTQVRVGWGGKKTKKNPGVASDLSRCSRRASELDPWVLQSRLNPVVADQQLKVFSDSLEVSDSHWSRTHAEDIHSASQFQKPLKKSQTQSSVLNKNQVKSESSVWMSLCLSVFSVEVNNFLKIDENQNEEVENELPDSDVSRNYLLSSQSDSFYL